MTPLLMMMGFAHAESVRRFALLAGTNDGGTDRVSLRFAESDATHLAGVLSDLGGFGTEDTVLVLDADRDSLEQGFRSLEHRLAQADGRREVVVYYSGHSDEKGLLLGDERVPYKELRERIDALSADVRIAILDSCASGALVRGKGGVHVPAFMLDQSTQVQGTAILTSSAADEAAQEADRLGGSFFTHYLVSGLRGAADVSGDGRVTLNEAYRFAFDETLARTEDTGHGAQHPSYDIQLTGSGDLVMTDLDESSAVLVIPEDVSGRVFVRDHEGRLVAELFKPLGRAVELGLAPGKYTVRLDQEPTLFEGVVNLEEGGRHPLLHEDLSETSRTASRARGNEELVVMPVSLSFLPAITTRGMQTGNQLTYFSLNLIAGRGHTVKGFETSAGASILDGDMWGMQSAGAANIIRGSSHGFGVAGAVNLVEHNQNGFHAAGATNLVGGQQRGFSVAGGANLVEEGGWGLQVAGGANLVADTFKGAQIATVNVAEDVRGVQIGVVNVGGNVSGAQIGVVNISEHIDGAPIGLINIVKDGMHHALVWGDESLGATVGLKLGSQHVYTLFGVGGSVYEEGYTAAVMGMGGRIRPSEKLFVDLEGLAQNVYWEIPGVNENDSPLITKARGMVGLDVSKHLSPFVGVSGNLSIQMTPDTDHNVTPVGTTEMFGGSQFWPGVFAGVQLQ